MVLVSAQAVVWKSKRGLMAFNNAAEIDALNDCC